MAAALGAAAPTAGKAERLADSYFERTLQERQLESGPYGGVVSLRDGRVAWTVVEPGKVQIYDVESQYLEWSKELDRPESVAFVPGESPRLWIASPENHCIYWLSRLNGDREGPWATSALSVLCEGRTISLSLAKVLRDRGGLPLVDQESGAGLPLEVDGLAVSRLQALTFWQDQPKAAGSEHVSGAVWVADRDNDRVVGFDAHSGAPVGSLGAGLLKLPLDLEAIDLQRLAVVSRTGGHVLSRDGSLLYRFNCHMMIGNAVTFDPRPAGGILSVADEYTDRLCLFCGATGRFLRSIAARGSLSEGTGARKSLAFHAGDEGYACKLFLADYLTKRLSVLDVGEQDKPPAPAKVVEEDPAASRGGSRGGSRGAKNRKAMRDKLRTAQVDA